MWLLIFCPLMMHIQPKMYIFSISAPMIRFLLTQGDLRMMLGLFSSCSVFPCSIYCPWRIISEAQARINQDQGELTRLRTHELLQRPLTDQQQRRSCVRQRARAWRNPDLVGQVSISKMSTMSTINADMLRTLSELFEVAKAPFSSVLM